MSNSCGTRSLKVHFGSWVLTAIILNSGSEIFNRWTISHLDENRRLGRLEQLVRMSRISRIKHDLDWLVVAAEWAEQWHVTPKGHISSLVIAIFETSWLHWKEVMQEWSSLKGLSLNNLITFNVGISSHNMSRVRIPARLNLFSYKNKHCTPSLPLFKVFLLVLTFYADKT